MQLHAVNFIPLLGSLYMFRVFYTPIIRSTIFELYLQPLVQTIVSSQLLTPSVATDSPKHVEPRWESVAESILWSVPVAVDTVQKLYS